MVTAAKGNAAAGRTVTDYMAPSPGVGVHRFIFLLFKGTIEAKKADERITWDVSKFMNVNPQLTPVAYNFMCVLFMCGEGRRGCPRGYARARSVCAPLAR